MRAAASVTALFPERSTDPLEFVDYRLAETPGGKGRDLPSEIPRLSARGRDLAVRDPSALPIATTMSRTTSPSASTIATNSTVRSASAFSAASGAGRHRRKCFADILHPELDRGKTIIDPTRFVADPDKAGVFPELPYVTRAARLYRLRPFQRRHRPGQSFVPNIGRSIARYSCRRPLGEPKIVSRADQAGRVDGRRLSRDPRQGVPALPVHAFKRFRAADAVRALRRARCFLARGRHHFRARLDGAEFLRRAESRSRFRPPPAVRFCTCWPDLQAFVRRFCRCRDKSGDFGPRALAFTVAPHLQTINYRGRFSRFVGI